MAGRNHKDHPQNADFESDDFSDLPVEPTQSPKCIQDITLVHCMVLTANDLEYEQSSAVKVTLHHGGCSE